MNKTAMSLDMDIHKNTSSFTKNIISSAVILVSISTSAYAVEPVVWVDQVRGGEVRFYDWGYAGPSGRLANDYSSIGGFNGASQIQHVVTTAADRLTPDSPNTVLEDFSNASTFYNANMDGQTNFYNWAYTSPAGSTFSNMQIDADGDYYIARNDMSFNYYGSLDYKREYVEGSIADNPLALPYITIPDDGVYDTNIGFQPYALSDATGWCGSVNASNPGALEAMAGQVTFDFGFEAFLPTKDPGANGVWDPGEGAMQIVQDFGMRSYGSMEIEISSADGGTGDFLFQSDAVVNNTNPLDSTEQTDINGDVIMIEVAVMNMDGTPALDEFGNPRTMMVPDKRVGGGGVDENYYNQVSFMGGGVVPDGVWIRVEDTTAAITNDNILEVLEADDGGANTMWHANSFAGYPFLLRADGIRIVDALDFDLYSDLTGIPASAFDANGKMINLEGVVIEDLSAVPVPASVWLLASGLFALVGFARKRQIN